MSREPKKEAPELPDPARRTALKTSAAVLATAAVAGTLLSARQAKAAKASQAVAMYQGKPHGQQECDRCTHFVPGKSPTAAGTCQVVDGSISPKGWCVLFAPKA